MANGHRVDNNAVIRRLRAQVAAVHNEPPLLPQPSLQLPTAAVSSAHHHRELPVHWLAQIEKEAVDKEFHEDAARCLHRHLHNVDQLAHQQIHRSPGLLHLHARSFHLSGRFSLQGGGGDEGAEMPRSEHCHSQHCGHVCDWDLWPDFV